MFILALFIAVACAKPSDHIIDLSKQAPGATNDVYTFNNKCKTAVTKNEVTHNACNYYKYTGYEKGVFDVADILYDREKCTTCCRVLFVSEYNFQTGKSFTDRDDKDSNMIRFTMDLEFDYKEFVRTATGSYEQCILARPLQGGKANQYWEFAPYMMYINYNIPQRVHDVRSSATAGHRLIIWKKKAPLDPGTNNQRFIYIHPYDTDYYPASGSHVYVRGRTYKKHFFVPFQTAATLCYEIKQSNEKDKLTDLKTTNVHTWAGNAYYDFKASQAFQIIAQKCTATTSDDNYYRQLWVPVFA